MERTCDLVILGTGLAALVSALDLHARGHDVILLNPELGFFAENSELPLETLVPFPSPASLALSLKLSTLEGALEQISPPYPGSLGVRKVESLTGASPPQPAEVRERWRVAILPDREGETWARAEEVFLQADTLKLKPQEMEGLRLLRRFPGVAAQAASERRGYVLGKLVDVDAEAYRNAVLEYAWERMGEDRILLGASHWSWVDGELRVTMPARSERIRPRAGFIGWLTPRTERQIRAQTSDRGWELVPQARPRLVEDWSLVSRASVTLESVGMFEEFCVWGEEPAQGDRAQTLRVLRTRLGSEPRSIQESAAELQRFCGELLAWERMTVRRFSRTLLSGRPAGVFPQREGQVWVTGAEGSVPYVVNQARALAQAAHARILATGGSRGV